MLQQITEWKEWYRKYLKSVLPYGNKTNSK